MACVNERQLVGLGVGCAVGLGVGTVSSLLLAVGLVSYGAAGQALGAFRLSDFKAALRRKRT